jgi:colanic acid biosynthesis glycosyl transferase WcaI
MSEPSARPRVLVLNQYYSPGYEATARVLTELCEELAQEFDVTVVTGRVQGAPDLPQREVLNGVRVLRVRSSSYARERLGLRALNYVSYVVQALRAGFAEPRPDLVLCMTDPPFVADVALAVARARRVPLLVIMQDVFPEIATQLGRLRNPAVVAALRLLVGFYLRRADAVVAIGETMRARLERKGARPDRLHVIPNWVDTSEIAPRPRDNSWAREHGLVDRFVVMHSGNVGHAQDLDSLVRAATFLRDLADSLAIVIVGAGARHAALVELADRLETDTVRFLPYQPRQALPELLSSGDMHVVGLARGLAGYIVPSRLQGVLAAGRPVIAAAEEASETAQIVGRAGCGVVVPPGRPELLAATVRAAHAGELDLAGMGERARAWVVEQADRVVSLGAYRSLVRELVSDRRQT